MNRPPKPVPPPPRVSPPTTEYVRMSDPEWRMFVRERLLLLCAANLINSVAIIILGLRML